MFNKFRSMAWTLNMNRSTRDNEIDNKTLVEKEQEMHYFDLSNSFHRDCLFPPICHLAWSNA